MATVSHSEVENYLMCRRRHYYGYGLSLERINTSNSLSRGTTGHKLQEVLYRTILSAGDDPKAQRAAFDNAVSKTWAEFKELAKHPHFDDDKHISMQEMIFDWYIPNEPFVRQGWQILAVEQEFNLLYDPDTDAHYPFVIDLIAYDPFGALVVIDHKFLYDFYTMEASRLQPQVPKYIGALRGLNYKVDYGVYNMIRTRPLKVSSRNIPTDRVDQIELHPSNQRVVRTFEEQIGAAKEIQDLKLLPIEEQDRRAYRTANKMVCQHCSFKDLCAMELEGGNVNLLKRTEFKQRARRTFVETSEDAE